LVDIEKPRLIGGTLGVGSGYFFYKDSSNQLEYQCRINPAVSFHPKM
jgi:hypothetical protein